MVRPIHRRPVLLWFLLAVISVGSGVLRAATPCPAPAGEVPFGFRSASLAVDVAFEGPNLLVADAYGLAVWDATDPGNPVELGHWIAPANGSAVEALPNNRAVLGDASSRLTVVDLFHPAVPLPAGHVDLPEPPNDIAVTANGELALVADGDAGLQLVDLSDPENPAIAGFVENLGWVRAVAVSGTVAFVAATHTVTVVDVSNPANPSAVTSLDLTANVTDLAAESASGTVAVFASDVSGYLRVLTYDTTSHTLTQTGSIGLGSNTSGVTVTDTPGHVAVATGDHVVVVNVTNPSSPTADGSVATAGWTGRLACSNGVLGVAEQDSGFELLTWNGGDPVPAGTGGSHGMVWTVDGDGTLMVAADNAGGLLVENVTDPWNPQLLAQVPTTGGAVAAAIGIQQAFVAEGASGTGIVDLSNPASASETTVVDTGDAECVDVSSDGAYAYVGGGDGFAVVDAATAQVAGTIDSGTTGYLGALAAAGDRVYAVNWNDLLVIDVSNPAQPSVTGSADLSGANAVAADGTMAYVFQNTFIVVVDCSNPASPDVRGSVDLGAWGPPALAYTSGYVAALAGSDLVLVDVTDPDNPFIAATEPVTRMIEWVTVDGAGTLWWADYALAHAVTLQCREPAAEFTATVSGRRAAFTDRSLYGPTAWQWDFGDGATAAEPNPSHLYAADGVYTVTLTVTNDEGTDQISHQVQVGTPGDLNGDGLANGGDILDLVAEIFDLDGFDPATANGGAHAGGPAYDLDGDGWIASGDLDTLITLIAPNRP